MKESYQTSGDQVENKGQREKKNSVDKTRNKPPSHPPPHARTQIHTKVETEQKTWPNTKFKDEGVEFPRPLKVKSSTNQTNYCHKRK